MGANWVDLAGQRVQGHSRAAGLAGVLPASTRYFCGTEQTEISQTPFWIRRPANLRARWLHRHHGTAERQVCLLPLLTRTRQMPATEYARAGRVEQTGRTAQAILRARNHCPRDRGFTPNGPESVRGTPSGADRGSPAATGCAAHAHGPALRGQARRENQRGILGTQASRVFRPGLETALASMHFPITSDRVWTVARTFELAQKAHSPYLTRNSVESGRLLKTVLLNCATDGVNLGLLTESRSTWSSNE